jgi:hypothetical protein
MLTSEAVPAEELFQGTVDDLRREVCEIAGQSLSLSLQPVGEGRSWLVRLGNGHRQVQRVCDVLRVVPVARELAGDLRDHPFVASEAVTETGLPSYGWWKGVGLATANEARRWVRWRLLKLPAMTDAEADRFIASLDPPKREDLLRRAKDGKGVAGF